MPAIPNSEHNFLLGLSDFWTKFFQDSKPLSLIYDATQLEIGQNYLDLLSDVLSIKLEDVPLFSKKYFHYLPIREDQLVHFEGASIEDDRFVFTPSTLITNSPSLLNRVIFPTKILEDKLDYEVVNTRYFFKQNLFNTDGLNSIIDGIPYRTVQVQFPFDFQEISVSNWESLNICQGDVLHLKVQNGFVLESQISLVKSKLVLTSTDSNFLTDIRRYSYVIDILRIPFNTKQINKVIPNQPSLELNREEVGAVIHNTFQFTQATLDIDFTETDGGGHPLYFNKYIYINDPVFDENNGVFHIRNVIDRYTIEVAKPAPFQNPTPSDWETSTKYTKNTIITFDSKPYYALSDHISDVFATDLANGLWESYLLDIVILDYDSVTAIPVSKLEHEFLIKDSVTVYGRRLLAKKIGDIVYPAKEQLIENVDYILDLDNGKILHLSPWDSIAIARISYNWRLQIYHQEVAAPINWEPASFYYKNNRVKTEDGKYWYAVEEGLSSALFSLDKTRWRLLQNPFTPNPVYFSRELAFWAVDIKVEENRLYTNFGYLLLGGIRPSTETYRQFLAGIMRLFVLGPAVGKLESALNVMAGLPVIREDNEILLNVDTGIIFEGTSGTIRNGQILRGGFFTTDGILTNPLASFFETDILATITISKTANSFNAGTYVIQSIIGPNTVKLIPAPLSDELDTGFIWQYQHTVINNQFTSLEYNFVEADINGFIVIEEASNSANINTFKILGILNSHTVILESFQNLIDENNITWKLTRTNSKIITTNKNTYVFPFLIDLRHDILLVESINTLKFNSFESLTTAFVVADYLVDPSWFANLAIPKQLLTLIPEDANRREIAPIFIKHIVDALDHAAIGDPGLIVGRDDENQPVPERNCDATWIGGNTLYLFEPIAVLDDKSQYIVLGSNTPDRWQPDTLYEIDNEVRYDGLEYYAIVDHTSGSIFNIANWELSIRPYIKGSFKILNVSSDGLRLLLENFPTPEMASLSLPDNYKIVKNQIKLPPFLHRRTVGFVMMDRFLKYHSFRVKINLRTELTSTFISDLNSLISQSKPTYTYIFVDPSISFKELVTVSEEFSLGAGVHFVENLLAQNNYIYSGTVLTSGECYNYEDGVESGVFTTTPYAFTIPTPAPSIGGPPSSFFRVFYIFGRFTTGNNSDLGRICKEGVDYTFNYTNGDVVVLDPEIGGSFDLYWIRVFLWIDPDLTIGRNATVSGGLDPTFIRESTIDPSFETGILDRALTIYVV